MNKLEQVINELYRLEENRNGHTPLHRLDARLKLLFTFLFLLGVLSIPLSQIEWLLLAAVVPLIGCLVGKIHYGSLFKHSLLVLPFVLCMALFNWVVDRQVVPFFAMLLRGLLTVQATLLLIRSTGFYNLCRALKQLHFPDVLTVQLYFLYRYLLVLLQEALSLQRAVYSRAYGRKRFPIRVWGLLMGQLLLRTLERSQRIHRAMLARGFSGRL